MLGAPSVRPKNTVTTAVVFVLSPEVLCVVTPSRCSVRGVIDGGVSYPRPRTALGPSCSSNRIPACREGVTAVAGEIRGRLTILVMRAMLASENNRGCRGCSCCTCGCTRSLPETSACEGELGLGLIVGMVAASLAKLRHMCGVSSYKEQICLSSVSHATSVHDNVITYPLS